MANHYRGMQQIARDLPPTQDDEVYVEYGWVYGHPVPEYADDEYDPVKIGYVYLFSDEMTWEAVWKLSRKLRDRVASRGYTNTNAFIEKLMEKRSSLWQNCAENVDFNDPENTVRYLGLENFRFGQDFTKDYFSAHFYLVRAHGIQIVLEKTPKSMLKYYKQLADWQIEDKVITL